MAETKYHITNEGRVMPCKYKDPSECPYGELMHYNSEEEAYRAVENMLKKHLKAQTLTDKKNKRKNVREVVKKQDPRSEKEKTAPVKNDETSLAEEIEKERVLFEQKLEEERKKFEEKLKEKFQEHKKLDDEIKKRKAKEAEDKRRAEIVKIKEEEARKKAEEERKRQAEELLRQQLQEEKRQQNLVLKRDMAEDQHRNWIELNRMLLAAYDRLKDILKEFDKDMGGDLSLFASDMELISLREDLENVRTRLRMKLQDMEEDKENYFTTLYPKGHPDRQAFKRKHDNWLEKYYEKKNIYDKVYDLELLFNQQDRPEEIFNLKMIEEVREDMQEQIATLEEYWNKIFTKEWNKRYL